MIEFKLIRNMGSTDASGGMVFRESVKKSAKHSDFFVFI